MTKLWSSALVGIIVVVLAATASAQASSDDTLVGGQTLSVGETLVSPDNHYELVMQGDGNLVLYLLNDGVMGRALWSSGTSGNPGADAVLQSNGDLVVLSGTGATLWSSNTSSAGCTNLDVQEDGNLVIYDQSGPVWSSQTINDTLEPGEELTEGQDIVSADDQYSLAMQTDGNLVVYGPTGALWATYTTGSGNYAIMQGDGDFVVYSPANTELFSSGTATAGSVARIQTDGNFVVYSPSNQALWSTDTSGSRTAGAGVEVPPAFQACPAPMPMPTQSTPTPVQSTPTPSTDPALKRLRVRVTLSWTWNRRHTRLRRLTVPRMPRAAELTITCHGRGCTHRRLRADRRDLSKLLRRLDRSHYVAGDRLEITISEPGFKPERVVLSIRDGAKPRVRVLAP